LTKFDHHEIGALYSRGHTAAQVAERLGCSIALVLRVARLQRINRSRTAAHKITTLTIAQKEEVRGYRQRGWSWVKIGFVMKLSAKTIIKQCTGSEYDKLTNCKRCQTIIVNAHRTQKYCKECGDKQKRENARFYNEIYQKRLRGEIEEGEE